MHRSTLVFCLFLATAGFTGPNQNAKLYLDFDPGTPVIDSIGGCLKDSSITAAVRIEGASKLYSYQLFLKHDTASLQFISGKAGSDQIPTMLEKNGGSLSFFTAKPSMYDSARVSIGCALSGNVVSQCVSDSGILCLLKFRHRKADTTKIAIDSMLFLDCEERPDSGLTCFGGTIVPSTGVAVNRKPQLRKNALPGVVVREGALDIDFGTPTNYVLVAVNTLGKQVGVHRGVSGKLHYDCRRTGAADGVAGLTVVHIRWSGNELTVPVLR